jgi:signal transduction histidine kinase
MDFLRTFFALNRDIIYFAYGLVFFVLGLAIALQSRNYSRLDLARCLKWLAAFGFVHAFNEWGDLFIPIQEDYANPETILLLHRIHLLLLAVSFAFLFEFGVTLLKPLGLRRWIHKVPAILLAAWFFVVYFPLPTLLPDFHTWHNTADALARYFIGFPGGILAAYGLRKHTLHRIVPLQVPHIVKMLRFAGMMLAFYAVFGGLIPPPVPFYPGNLINSVNFEQIFLAPVPVFRSLIGLGLVIAIIRALEVFDVETARMIEAIEQQQILITERSRIARDLHDGAIQKVYTAGLLIESARKQAGDQTNPLNNRLEKAELVLNDAIADLRHSLGELKSPQENDPFPLALRKLAEDTRFRSLVDISLVIDLPDGEDMAPVRAEHVLSVVNEALANIVRHAQASQVLITVSKQEDQFRLTIEDDGIGITESVQVGYGLRNMRDRARMLGGEIEFTPAKGKGTCVSLEIPWKDKR